MKTGTHSVLNSIVYAKFPVDDALELVLSAKAMLLEAMEVAVFQEMADIAREQWMSLDKAIGQLDEAINILGGSEED